MNHWNDDIPDAQVWKGRLLLLEDLSFIFPYDTITSYDCPHGKAHTIYPAMIQLFLMEATETVFPVHQTYQMFSRNYITYSVRLLHSKSFCFVHTAVKPVKPIGYRTVNPRSSSDPLFHPPKKRIMSNYLYVKTWIQHLHNNYCTALCECQSCNLQNYNCTFTTPRVNRSM